jgi:hypothetical protein
MEGVGARLGRSSTRYGPTVVFTGPVRKWNKKWIIASPSPPPLQNNNNGGTATTNVSHLRLYKWILADNLDQPPTQRRRKFKYIPVAVLEEKNKEEEEEGEEQQVDDDDKEAKPSENESAAATKLPSSKNRDAFDEKPDINDTPMEEDVEESKDDVVERQDLNETTLDLSLGLKSNDDDNDDKDDEDLERANST